MPADALPDLEDRFLEPEGWRWNHFERIEGRRIRFGCVFPKDKAPDAVIVCLPGLGEFGEKYFETARWAVENNFAFWVIDWMGQGGSNRYLKNPHKRHSSGFENDIDDLHSFITGYVKPASVNTDVGRIPSVMLAHSMGGNIGLRYLARYPDTFTCAAFSAPMLGIPVLKKIPFSGTILRVMSTLAHSHYAPGEQDRRQEALLLDLIRLSSDPIRRSVQDKWQQACPPLAFGGVTNGWLYHARKTCQSVMKTKILQFIQTPCLIALAGNEQIVDNASIETAINSLPNAKRLYLEGACHEILMEQDTYRDAFLSAFYTLIQEHVIDKPETLQPF